MDYEGLVTDLSWMDEHATTLACTFWLDGYKCDAIVAFDFARQCREFRHELYSRGYGFGKS